MNDENINQLIDQMDSLNETVSKETVQHLTTQCSSLLYNAADAAGMIKQITPRPNLARKKSKPTRPWFNAESFIREYSKYFDDLLSGERSLPFWLLVLVVIIVVSEARYTT